MSDNEMNENSNNKQTLTFKFEWLWERTGSWKLTCGVLEAAVLPQGKHIHLPLMSVTLCLYSSSPGNISLPFISLHAVGEMFDHEDLLTLEQ